MQRRWYPLAVDGDRIHVLQEPAWDSDRELDLDVQHQRGNVYDRSELRFVIP